MSLKIYVEGGGDTNALRTKCRRGFSEFFRKAGLEGRMPRVVASGGRQEAFEDFCTSLGKARTGDFIALLVDSEAPIPAGSNPWMHLKARDNWDRPATATDDNAHLMVQCMEAWFLADKDNLAAFFGNGFNRNALPSRADVENIAKTQALDGLRSATRLCDPEGEYGKGRHSFDILARLDPQKVVAASAYAKRLVDTLRHRAEA